MAEETPEDLSPQVDAIAEILDAMGIPRWGVPGYEADDVLGTVAQRPEPTIVVTGDRDLVQLIDDHTSVLLTVNGGMEKWPLVDTADAIQRFGVPPSAYPDMAVLRGDPSDGLPGVPGIGAKTAVTLIEAFGDLEGVIEAASAHPPVRPMTARLAERITHEAAAVRRALTVTKVVRDLPLPAAIPSWQGVAEGHALAALAGRWGVERQVSALITELDGMRQMLAE